MSELQGARAPRPPGAYRGRRLFLAQIYGKPKTNIQTTTDVTINVVSRLGAALERAAEADVDLPADDVRELEAG